MDKRAREKLDLSGLHCPEVVLRAKSYSDKLPGGACFEIVSTDPLSRIDIPLWAHRAGHRVESERVDGKAIRFVVTLTK